ncbi:hypothetical protein Lal_00046419 [Lupinus albus]|nr:hypothetical protein Lal_00046419 [Lupinus albus]
MSPPSSSIDATSSPKPAFSFKTDPFDASTRSFFLFVFFILFIRFCFIYFFGDCNHDHNPNRPTHDGDDNNTSTGLPINIINSYNTFKYNKKLSKEQKGYIVLFFAFDFDGLPPALEKILTQYFMIFHLGKYASL